MSTLDNPNTFFGELCRSVFTSTDQRIVGTFQAQEREANVFIAMGWKDTGKARFGRDMKVKVVLRWPT